MLCLKRKLELCLVAGLMLGCASTHPAPVVETPVEPAPVEVAQPVDAHQNDEPALSPLRIALLDAQKSQDAQQIESAARNIIDADPTSEDAKYAYLALAELNLASAPETARLFVERAYEITPNDYDVQMIYGRIAHAQTQTQNSDDEALDHFARAAQADTKNAAPCIAAAAILLNYLDIERANDQAKCAIEREPERCDAIAIFADARYAAKDYESAAKAYENYIQKDCNQSEDVLKRLAKLNETQLSDPKRACELYNQLLNLVPDDPNYKASRDYQCGL